MQTNPLTPRTSIPPPPARQPAIGSRTPSNSPTGGPPHTTRAALVWAATVAVLVLLGLLIAFILQNQEQVHVQYFGLVGSVPLGIALSIAAVIGGFLVAITGTIRIAQLRTAATRLHHRSPTRPPTKTRHQLFRHGHPAR
ncbi:LapA family protein [Arthrobacter sp. R4]|uniref:LapA family protein n=1 Tax=Arthrobacter sp. R4 TaxID=644417 RepID=UPI003ED991A5